MSRDLRILDPSESLPAVPNPPVPVIVVQYRRGWVTRLMMPVMILVTAAALLSHRVRMDDWRGVGHYLGLSTNEPKKVVAVPSEPPPERAPAPPLVVTVMPELPPVAMPAPSLLDVSKPFERLDNKPEVTALPAPPAPAPPVAAPSNPLPVPAPAPVVQANQIWDDIRKESERKQEEAKVLEAAKDFEFVQQQRLTEQKKREELKRERDEMADARKAFRDGLRAALALPEGRVGPAIRELCARDGVTLGTSVVSRPTELISTSAARRDRVEKLRIQRISEAAILCDLIRIESSNRVARRANARTPEDVVVRAARQLLLIPVTSSTSARPSSNTGVARTSRAR